MKKIKFAIAGMLLTFVLAAPPAGAQIPGLSLLSAAVKKVITALDLKVQRLQNQTLALQNAQQQVQNKLSLTRLTDISGWLGKERDLYQNYYDELQRIKSVISSYHQVKQLVLQQQLIITECRQGRLLADGAHRFSPKEISLALQKYDAVLMQNIQNVEMTLLAVHSTSLNMSDAERLRWITRGAAKVQESLNELCAFNGRLLAIATARKRLAGSQRMMRALGTAGK